MNAYIEAEVDWLAGWPEEPDSTCRKKQFYHLAKNLIETVRRRSVEEGISPDEHGRRVGEAYELLDDLHRTLNSKNDIGQAQKVLDDQILWEHKSIYSPSLGTGFHRVLQVWSIDGSALISSVRDYLEKPYLQTDRLDYLLTDALLYAEASAFQQELSPIDGPIRHRRTDFLVFGIKWVLIILASFFLHSISKEAFLLLGIAVITFQAIKTLRQNHPWAVHASMLCMYLHCDSQFYNPAVIWDMCKVLRDKGAVFDGVTYDLLQRQMRKA